MTVGDEGGARVVQATCHIGEAIEHEVGEASGVLFVLFPFEL